MWQKLIFVWWNYSNKCSFFKFELSFSDLITNKFVRNILLIWKIVLKLNLFQTSFKKKNFVTQWIISFFICFFLFWTILEEVVVFYLYHFKTFNRCIRRGLLKTIRILTVHYLFPAYKCGHQRGEHLLRHPHHGERQVHLCQGEGGRILSGGHHRHGGPQQPHPQTHHRRECHHEPRIQGHRPQR